MSASLSVGGTVSVVIESGSVDSARPFRSLVAGFRRERSRSGEGTTMTDRAFDRVLGELVAAKPLTDVFGWSRSDAESNLREMPGLSENMFKTALWVFCCHGSDVTEGSLGEFRAHAELYWHHVPDGYDGVMETIRTGVREWGLLGVL